MQRGFVVFWGFFLRFCFVLFFFVICFVICFVFLFFFNEKKGTRRGNQPFGKRQRLFTREDNFQV